MNFISFCASEVRAKFWLPLFSLFEILEYYFKISLKSEPIFTASFRSSSLDKGKTIEQSLGMSTKHEQRPGTGDKAGIFRSQNHTNEFNTRMVESLTQF